MYCLLDEILLTMRKSKGSDRNTYNNSGSSSSSGGPGSNNPGRSRTYSNSSGHSNHSVDIAESKEYELGSSSSGYGSNSRMNSMRAGSKEISDRMSGRFPAVPVEVEAKYLVDNMVRYMMIITKQTTMTIVVVIVNNDEFVRMLYWLPLN